GSPGDHTQPAAEFMNTRPSSHRALCQLLERSPRDRHSPIETLWNVGLFRLDVGRPDHLAPFCGFVGEVLAKVRWRTTERDTAQMGQSPPDLGVGNGYIDLPIEPVNNLGRRVLGRADAIKGASLKARYEFAHGRDVRQRLGTYRGRHSERT